LLALVMVALLGGCDRLRARGAVREGTEAYRAGDYGRAAERFRAAVKLEPSLATAHYNLGLTALAAFSAAPRGAERDRAAAEAIAALQRYAGLRPADPRPRTMLLSLWVDSGRYDDALGYFRARLERNPRDAETVKLLGVISSKAGRFDDALGWYRRRAELSPREPEAHYAIGTLCWERLHDRADVADGERIAVADAGIAALERATELRADYAEAFTYLNLLFRERALGQTTDEAKKQDLDRALRHYQRALGIVKARR
jgi:tetratricopeptide (TPR) repeat protein